MSHKTDIFHNAMERISKMEEIKWISHDMLPMTCHEHGPPAFYTILHSNHYLLNTI